MSNSGNWLPIRTPVDFKETTIGKILGVRQANYDGRPQLFLGLEDDAGEQFCVILTREMARDLWRLLGPHPLVEKFFRGGKGLQ